MPVTNRVSNLVVIALLLATGSVFGQEFDLGLSKARKKPAKTKFAISLTPATAKAGDEVTLTLKATVPSGFHIYSMTQKPDGAAPTKVDIARTVGLEVVDESFTADKKPHVSPGVDADSADLEEYRGSVTWTRKFRLKPDADPAQVVLEGLITFSMCTNPVEGEAGGLCIPGEEKFEVTLARAVTVPGDTAKAVESEEKPETKPSRNIAVDDPGAQPGEIKVDDQAPPPGAQAKPVEEVKPSKAALPAAKSVFVQPSSGTWRAHVSPKQAAPGETVTLTLEVDLKKGWHVYAASQQQVDGEGPQPMAVQFKMGTLEPMTAFKGPAPKEHLSTDPDWAKKKIVERLHEGKVRWTRTFKVPATAKPGDVPLSGAVVAQVCNESNCTYPRIGFQGTLTIAEKAIAGDLSLAPRNLSAAKADDETADPDPFDGAPSALVTGNEAAPPAPQDKGLVVFLITAVAAGFVSLLTPCVFPMVPITVSVFHKQAERQHTNPVLMAAIYAFSIILTFTIPGLVLSFLFGQSALNDLANHPWLNVGIALILLFFACNMLGMYEIVVPSWLLNATAGQQSRGGYVGVIFMGVTFTLTSFTCTFAFVGSLMAMAAAGQWQWPLLGLLAFSTAFALPFFLLALFPTMLSRLPKSGGWMNTIKVVMGFLEMGAGLKFLSNADIFWNGRPVIFDYQFVMCAWMVLAFVSGLYLLGQFRTPHDTPLDHVSVPRLLLSMGFLGLGAYLAVGLLGSEKFDGVIWDNIVAIAPPKLDRAVEDQDLGPTLTDGGLKYALDPDKALAAAIRQKKPLFVDITGVNCPNCRLMEHGPLKDPNITERLKNMVLVRVYVDRVPSVEFGEAKRLKARNIGLQENWYVAAGLPAYAVVSPTPDAFENSKSILSRQDMNLDTTVFAQFLDKGLSQWKGAAVAGGRPTFVLPAVAKRD